MKITLPSPETTPTIVFSHYDSRHIAIEQCVPEHGISYVVAGSLLMVEAGKRQVFDQGSLLFYRKNFLAKFIKQPAENGLFKAITVVFDRTMLSEFSRHHKLGCVLPDRVDGAAKTITINPQLQHFFSSLQSHFDVPLSDTAATLKQQEALRLLLQIHPALQSVLFEFGQPGKIDLETFMRRNFRVNIELKQLAYLTGRSLATFKRDFDRIFHMSPTRWLYQKRLEEAHYLLKEEDIRPSEVYLEVGFETLAHFSTSFKHFFGHTPSSVRAAGRQFRNYLAEAGRSTPFKRL